MTSPVVVVGDALLDRDVEGSVERLAPDAPVPVLDERVATARPGGAGLAAALLATDGREVVLVSALGNDAPGRELSRLLSETGVEVVDLGLDGPTPQKVRLCCRGRPLLRLDRGGPGGQPGPISPAARGAIGSARALLVSDYGRGMAREPSVRSVVSSLLGREGRRVPVVWDPHPRGEPPVEGVGVATPNLAELESTGRAGTVARGDAAELEPTMATAARRARRLRDAWRTVAVAVTLGAAGALLVDGDDAPLVVPAEPLPGSPDACGAGDRFATTMVGALADGALPSEAVVAAVHAATNFVAAGAVSGFLLERRSPAEGPGSDAESVVRSVRARGGTVVATGGCFDLLHAGHVALLRAARRLGDCLVVCLNSDRSVRRLKGPGRPLVPESDRAAVLLALDCVDAVTLFDGDTPDAALDRLRPDLFAKGGDYSGRLLPESATVERWGGQAVVLPYLAGRSTTELVSKALGAQR